MLQINNDLTAASLIYMLKMSSLEANSNEKCKSHSEPGFFSLIQLARISELRKCKHITQFDSNAVQLEF